jgi:hypothetical protein
MRIESDAFSYSSLKSIVIPANVLSITGSPFSGMNLSSCSIKSENRRFVFEKAFLIDVINHILIRNISASSLTRTGECSPERAGIELVDERARYSPARVRSNSGIELSQSIAGESRQMHCEHQRPESSTDNFKEV